MMDLLEGLERPGRCLFVEGLFDGALPDRMRGAGGQDQGQGGEGAPPAPGLPGRQGHPSTA